MERLGTLGVQKGPEEPMGASGAWGGPKGYSRTNIETLGALGLKTYGEAWDIGCPKGSRRTNGEAFGTWGCPKGCNRTNQYRETLGPLGLKT